MKTIFESERLKYVEISKELINDYLTMINDPSVYRNISKNEHIYTYEEELEWVNNKPNEESISFSMIEKDTNEFVGNIEIMAINNNIGEIGITITPSKQDKHYGTEALKAIIQYGFDKYNLDGYELNVFNTNQRAIKCYQNVGFVIDGVGKSPDDYHMLYKR